MWEINNNLQIITFLYSLVLGAIFEVLYDVFRSIRKIVNHKTITVFLEDIFYFLITAVITFIFLVAFTNGQVRGYILLGILVGFYAFYKLFSKYILSVFNLIFKWFYRLISVILKGYFGFFSKIYEIIAVFSENSINFLKKVLKNRVFMVYTIRK